MNNMYDNNEVMDLGFMSANFFHPGAFGSNSLAFLRRASDNES